MILLLVVCLVAGLLASFVVGGTRFGLIGDIALGIAGALAGGGLFFLLDPRLVMSDLWKALIVAFACSLILLLATRSYRTRSRRRRQRRQDGHSADYFLAERRRSHRRRGEGTAGPKT